MKSKIVIVSAVALFTAGAGMHIADYCPLHHHAKASIAHVTPKKVVKPTLLARRKL